MPILLLTPPFTQLNTPYPATAYLKGFLNTQGIDSYQADLGLELILRVFSKEGLQKMFAHIQQQAPTEISPNASRIIRLQRYYVQTIDAVIAFLQSKNPTLADLIVQSDFLPQASRFDQLDDLEWAFGAMGVQDKAKHLATLYLEDISDLIQELIDPYFGFSRYAERLGRSANSFDELYAHLQTTPSYMETELYALLPSLFERTKPDLVVLTVPFPGNLVMSLRIGEWIRKYSPQTKIAMGGGFANTELRSLSDARVFEYYDFVSLDDGEAPILHLIQHLREARPLALLKRTFTLVGGKVEYLNFSLEPDFKQAQTGTPDYRDLLLDKYISVIELANPMHRLWSDGRWNKLTMAHGCYWGKCTFCDISLAYIKDYEPLTAQLLCDRIETLLEQTGQNGFHFVDEAAPPALMRALSLEILKRGLSVVWWTNIRFEKSFSPDLCQLLRAAGCIAVSGGLEVASDRLLELIQKGVTVAQVAQAARNLTEAGIMVHAYLMYGFPTQTEQETVDSLEMVRQMFEAGVLRSGFWHQFAMTAHSPVGLSPESFSVRAKPKSCKPSFADNDVEFIDEIGTDADKFSFGLKKSLLNYMHGLGFDTPLKEWFDFKTPRTLIPKDYIQKALSDEALTDGFFARPHQKVVWIGEIPEPRTRKTMRKGKIISQTGLFFTDKAEEYDLSPLTTEQSDWVLHILTQISVYNNPTSKLWTFQAVREDFETRPELGEFELFWYNRPFSLLRDKGLLIF